MCLAVKDNGLIMKTKIQYTAFMWMDKDDVSKKYLQTQLFPCHARTHARARARTHTGLLKKEVYTFKNWFHKKILMQNPCPVYRWKGNLSKFWYLWSEAEHHWGCGCCYLWHAVTSVGRVALSILHLPRHTWGSHWVLVRCENNF
jgi:hypothetical protein